MKTFGIRMLTTALIIKVKICTNPIRSHKLTFKLNIDTHTHPGMWKDIYQNVGMLGIFLFAYLYSLTSPIITQPSLCTRKGVGAEIDSDLAHGAHRRRPGPSPALLILPSLQWKSSFLFQNPFCIRKRGTSYFKDSFHFFLPCKSCGSGPLKYCLKFSLKKQGDYLPSPCCRKETL